VDSPNSDHRLLSFCRVVQVPIVMTIITLQWAMNKFITWRKVILKYKVVGDAIVGNLGICEVEDYTVDA
jgi:hypothetical protein